MAITAALAVAALAITMIVSAGDDGRMSAPAFPTVLVIAAVAMGAIVLAVRR